MTAPRRIPPAECTEHPWWMIVDPAQLRLPHPSDTGDVGPCEECGAEEGDDCVWTAEESDAPGTPRDEPHEGRPDYRTGVEVNDITGAITGPFLSRASAEEHLRRAAHRFSSRARVWCAPGSDEWARLCREAPLVDDELVRMHQRNQPPTPQVASFFQPLASLVAETFACTIFTSPECRWGSRPASFGTGVRPVCDTCACGHLRSDHVPFGGCSVAGCRCGAADRDPG